MSSKTQLEEKKFKKEKWIELCEFVSFCVPPNIWGEIKKKNFNWSAKNQNQVFYILTIYYEDFLKNIFQYSIPILLYSKISTFSHFFFSGFRWLVMCDCKAWSFTMVSSNIEALARWSEINNIRHFSIRFYSSFFFTKLHVTIHDLFVVHAVIKLWNKLKLKQFNWKWYVAVGSKLKNDVKNMNLIELMFFLEINQNPISFSIMLFEINIENSLMRSKR